MFSKLLIANRGEIALRVARTCRELGIATVGVHSTADRDSEIARFADQCVQIGPAAAKRSYLNAPAILEAALQTGAEAIHPGYGFLSEDADFAEACEANGIVFVGPPPSVMYQLHDKAAARRLMASAGLPVLPGSVGTVASAEEARTVAGEIGHPLIIKAVAGGGGRGMTVVRDPRDLSRAYRQTRAHAQAVFGDSGVYLERLVEGARHVEVQVLADRFGNVVHLGERDCSVQRRHQKLVEETPAPGLPAGLLDEICAAAMRGARAVGYVGAGTFEFLVDPRHDFFFMEINCRLQVEHPVTEMVTGIDLVAEQIAVAAGQPLRYTQRDVVRRGVSIECRVNAEDPSRGFLPTPGRIHRFQPPGGPFTRVDTYGFAGMRMPAEYDPLLAKVIVWAPTRDAAVERMRRALGEFLVEGPGVRTTTEFLREAVGHRWFREARHNVRFVDEMLAERERERGTGTGTERTG
jgi:acetyl-CoA carboxylase biotin carboxylase subunit